MKKIALLLCLVIALLFVGCNRHAVNPDAKIPSKKDIILEYGVPFEEISLEGMDVLVYEYCGYGFWRWSCQYIEYYFVNDKLFKELVRDEQTGRTRRPAVKLDVDVRK